MALREELGKLDSAVAAGQMTVEEFRTQRDHLLAAAGSGPATSAPFPPAYRWGKAAETDDQTRSVPRPAAAEDRTQVVARPSAAAGERTQVVRRRPQHPRAPAPEDRTQVVRRSPPRDADRTQVVRAGEMPAGYANVGAPPWARGPALPPTAANRVRPEGTLPPWTLNQPSLVQPTPTGARPTGYVGAGTFRAERSRRWLLPVLALVLALLILGLVLYVTL